MENQLIASEDNSDEEVSDSNTFSLFKESMRKILDAFPLPTALLDRHEKVITVNLKFLKLFLYPCGDHLTGKMPEEIFTCINAVNTIRNNQMADRCQNCGTSLSLKDNVVICQKFTENCNLTFADKNRPIEDLPNLKVTTSSFTYNGEQYYLFTINDISNNIRRRLLEKVFFHDILNKAGNILGILETINYVERKSQESEELFELLRSTSQDLFDEIKFQRDLTAAENNELKPEFSPISSLDILHSTKNEIINNDVASDREILISSSSADRELMTDRVLLRRIILNMLKNALEATTKGGKVVMGCEPVNKNNFRFWVHNDTSIPDEIQVQLFNKSTSTKGYNRGLGTFSMRLFGEKYLKGKVNFISSEASGTQFMIDLPMQHGNESIM